MTKYVIIWGRSRMRKNRWYKLECVQKKLEKIDKEYRKSRGKKKEGLFAKLINQLIYRDKID